MGFKCGIVGLPNVGKSTLFNALTRACINAENFPFCTIEPNVGVVPMPDPRLDKLAAIVKPQKIIPTSMNFVDIAGLVKGASKGEGLGNKFLANIREADAIAHVVRCFVDPNVVHVSGDVDPISDIEIVNTELALADMETIERARQRLKKVSKSGDKTAIAQQEVLAKIQQHLDQGHPVRTLSLNEKEQEIIKPYPLLTQKPVLYIANVSETGFDNNPLLQQVEELAKQEHADIVPICAAIEAEMVELSEEDKKVFLADMHLSEPGLNRVIRAGYHLLNLMTYFTAGEKEVRAWTVERDATAPEAAGKIHTDFVKGFIRAEVIAYTDFIEYHGEQGAKQAGKWRLEGKEYVVQDGDVMHFRFG